MAEQHWLVRTGYDYRVYVGEMPGKTKRDEWARNRNSDVVCTECVYFILHPDYHLAPGGGPVLLGEW